MKIVIRIIKIILILLLTITLFFWMSLYGSGYTPPRNKEITYGIYTVVLGALLALLIFLRRRLEK
ncbi:hypothetical protein [Emticicia sp. 17c]|uniref:hypothetical protein n=1 Tax=Emticicia sp. 17c TaxID=3127704 RepID=UPI00301C8246